MAIFKYERFPDLSAYDCQILSGSDSRVKKGGTDRHRGTLPVYIVDMKAKLDYKKSGEISGANATLAEFTTLRLMLNVE